MSIRLFLFTIMLFMHTVSQATIVGYNFEWVGSANVTMTGMFTYDDVDAVDGAIRDFEVNSLMFEGFDNGSSLGVSNNAIAGPGFNFNFNTVAGQFFLGGDATGDAGQNWDENVLAFAAGTVSSLLATASGSVIHGLIGGVPLTASLKTPNLRSPNSVPVPAAVWLFGTALIGLVGISRKKKVA